jgi:class 3 adenylate cyclase
MVESDSPFVKGRSVAPGMHHSCDNQTAVVSHGPPAVTRFGWPSRNGSLAAGRFQVRAGLHTGECEIRGDDIGGIGVHIGARVSALAGPNDVLVSSTLRDLVIGSGLEFEERGAHELKGVPGEWHLFAVASA